MAPPDLDLSVIVITHNEEDNLDRCLGSLPPGAEIVVVDSGSGDATVAIARRHGAHVMTRPFTHFAEQKNFALDHATRGWVLSLDADEELTAPLREALPAVIGRADGPVAYHLPRKLVFLGRQLRFGKSADHPLRLFRRQAGRFHGSVHEAVKTDGAVASWPHGGVIRHYSYRDLDDYFARFNRYTSAVAERHWREGRRGVAMTRHVLRPWAEFLQRYVLRLGFLDGYPGYTYALISSLYTYVKYAKLIERGTRERPHADA